jgi:hypothetical protein
MLVSLVIMFLWGALCDLSRMRALSNEMTWYVTIMAPLIVWWFIVSLILCIILKILIPLLRVTKVSLSIALESSISPCTGRVASPVGREFLAILSRWRLSTHSIWCLIYKSNEGASGVVS